MYIQTRRRGQLDGWMDTIGQVVGIAAQERAGSRAVKMSQAESAARITEARSNVEAARLALQAEALKAQQPKGGIASTLTSPVVLLGGAGALAALLFFMVKRRKRR